MEKIRDARRGLSGELAKAKSGQTAADGIQQLAFMESKLKELAEELASRNWREHSRSKPGMARMVVDTWPPKHALGDLIVEIEYLYGRLK